MFLTGLKSFLGSFALSLFMIFSINSFLGVSKTPSSVSSLPTQNISLFLKNIPHSYQKTDKIALMKPIEDDTPSVFSSHNSEKVLTNQIKDIEEKEVANIEFISSNKKDVPPSLKKNSPQEKGKTSNQKKNTSKAHKNKSFNQNITVTLSDSIKNDLALASDKPVLSAKAKEDTDRFVKKAEATPSKEIFQEKALPSLPKVDSSEKEEKIVTIGNYKDEGKLLIPLEKDNEPSRKSSTKYKINPASVENQVAMADFNKPVAAMVTPADNKSSPKEEKDSEWQTMAEKHDDSPQPRPSKELYERPQVQPAKQESPWIAAKGTKFPDNNTILDQEFYKNGEKLDLSSDISDPKSLLADNKNSVKVAGEVVNNILIPIPEDILNNKNLMPDLVSDPKNKPLEDELKLKEAASTSNENISEIPFIASKEDSENSETKQKSKGILDSLTSLFSSSEGTDDDTSEQEKNIEEEQNVEFADKPSSFKFLAKNSKKMKILPSEIRLSFQPDRAEISGKTLDWLKAFAQKAIENDDVALEIRIDGSSSYALQQKRLNLLYNILTNLGLGYAKVHTVFTAREPNSFILRAVKTSEDSNKKRFDPASSYYRM